MDLLDLVDFVQPLQSKTISNSRVLGYGQLKGHVASIVSMFYQNKVLRKEVCPRCTGLWNIVPTRYGAWKAGCCLQEILQRKVFLNKTLLKPLRYCDIYERNYIIFKYLFQQRYRYVDQP